MDKIQAEIERILIITPCLLAKEIAKKINLDKKSVNSFLYSHKEFFVRDDQFRWSVAGSSFLKIEFEGDQWIDNDSFENTLKGNNSPLESSADNIIFIIPKGCQILLEVAAKLLALCNQLSFKGKKVTIDFSSCNSTFGYLNRMGFFDQLLNSVSILPDRPEVSGAELYRENSNSLMEFGIIDSNEPDESIPKQLKMAFISHTGEKYSQTAFTIISELFGNVRDHSKTPTHGFAALQFYKGRRHHIQTVVSDCGKGIIGTLRPVLEKRYSELALRLGLSKIPLDVLLLKEVFEEGRISQIEDDARGLGLKRSRDMAAKFDADISIRQENFELKLLYRNGELDDYKYELNLSKLYGTHICFDFYLDK